MAQDYARAFYNSGDWDRVRKAYARSRGGLCELCLAKGIVHAGTVVHHRIPITLLAVLLIAGIVGLILNFAGRKIYGVWDITSGGQMENDIQLSSYKSAKGSKAEIDRILSDLGLETGFPKACLKAGNQFGKKIFACNLGNMDNVYYNDMPVDDFKKKQVEIKVGGSLTLERDGRTVTFTRISNNPVVNHDDDTWNANDTDGNVW